MSAHAPSKLSPIDYEERELPTRLLAGWVVGLFVGLAGILAFVYFVYGTPKMSPEPQLVLTRPMNQPALQPQAAGDLKVFLERQNAQLETYGWVNKQQGVVRLPIDRAIDLVLQRGLAARGSR